MLKRKITKRRDMPCSICEKRMHVVFYANKKYRGGHYFGKVPLYRKSGHKEMPRGAASGKLISGRNRADEIGFNYPTSGFLAQGVAGDKREACAFLAREVNHHFVCISFAHTFYAIQIFISAAENSDGISRVEF